MPEADQPRPRTLAEKLDHLFRTVHPRGEGEYSHDQVARAIEKRGGPSISAGYIWLLRTGRRDNPTKKHLEALADFFGVPPAYFFDDEQAARVDAQLDLLAALRDAGVRRIALRASGLQPHLKEAVGDLIDRLLEGEGAAPGQESTHDAPRDAGRADPPARPDGSSHG